MTKYRKLPVDEMERLTVEAFHEAPKFPIALVLDNVRSMHNVGSVLRTADAFRIDKVYMCGITPKPPHREIRKTAIGAEESVDWEHHPDAVVLCKELKEQGYQLLPVEQAENTMPLEDFIPLEHQPIALVLGHEITGVQQEILDLADLCLEIPQFGTKHSLNISVTAGIVLHWMVSQMGIWWREAQ
ncbi:MAG: RNA methyltransferase [Bacteroidota bacterium]